MNVEVIRLLWHAAQGTLVTMRVVLVCVGASDGHGGMVPASQVRDVAVQAWEATSPHADVVGFAIGDGGPRSSDAIQTDRSIVGGVECVRIEDDADGSRRMMLAPRAGAPRWNPLDLATGLLGLAAQAKASGVRTSVVIPVGDADCAGDATELWGGAVAVMRDATDALDMTVLCASDRPLVGFHGMSSALRDGRESDPTIAVAAQQQEERWARVARDTDPQVARTTLIGSSRLSDAPGTGAASGLAYCLGALGARIVTDAVGYIAHEAGVNAAINGDTAVAVAITAPLTPTTLDHGLSSALARAASIAAVPAVCIAPEVHVGRRDLMSAGVAAAYESGTGTDSLEAQVRRVAQTWTPAR